MTIGLGLNAELVQAQEKDVHDLVPKHGGIVTESNHMEYELVIKPDSTELYIRDHGKAVDLSQAKAKLTVLNSGKKTETELIGGSTMLKGEAVITDGKGFTALATVEFSGKKKSTVRFKSN